MLISEPIHKLIYATDKDIILKYLERLQLKKSQLAKVNAYRQLAGLESIALSQNRTDTKTISPMVTN